VVVVPTDRVQSLREQVPHIQMEQLAEAPAGFNAALLMTAAEADREHRV
jgi:hypothetical protein